MDSNSAIREESLRERETERERERYKVCVRIERKMERERERESKDARAPLWSPRCCRRCFFFFVVALVINLRSRRAVKSNTCGTESVKKSFSTPSLSRSLLLLLLRRRGETEGETGDSSVVVVVVVVVSVKDRNCFWKDVTKKGRNRSQNLWQVNAEKKMKFRQKKALFLCATLTLGKKSKYLPRKIRLWWDQWDQFWMFKF